MLKVWGRTNSINVQKVLWCCGELSLDYERIDAGNAHGIVDTPEYLAMNPNQFVPTIEDGNFQLWESNVIVRYLAEKFRHGELFPTEIERRFDAERWMDWQATRLWPALRPLFISLIRTPERQRDWDIISKGERECAAAFRILDARLADRAFLAGAAFSMADIPAAVTAHRWYALDIDHPKLPHLHRWYDAMCLRRVFQETVMTPLS